MKLLLDPAQVARWLEPAALEAVTREAMISLSSGAATAPPRIAVRAPLGLLAAMPGRAAGVLGAKLVSVFPENPTRGLPGHQALIALFDESTGEPLALLDGTAITAARTAAVSAVATRCLARNDAKVLAILGTGVQAAAHWRALTTGFGFQRVVVAGRTPARVLECANAWNAEPAPSFEAAVRDAEVVCACTHADLPVVRRSWLRPGTHVNSVGIGGHELDQAALDDALLVVEAMTAFDPFPIGAYELQGRSASGACELGAILAGRASGRSDPAQITVFKSVGHAVLDVAAAAHVWRQASHVRMNSDESQQESAR